MRARTEVRDSVRRLLLDGKGLGDDIFLAYFNIFGEERVRTMVLEIREELRNGIEVKADEVPEPAPVYVRIDGAYKHYSKLLGQDIFWVRDEGKKAEIEGKHPGVAVFTVDEVGEMLDQCYSAKDLRTIVEVKQLFPGTVLHAIR